VRGDASGIEGEGMRGAGRPATALAVAAVTILATSGAAVAAKPDKPEKAKKPKPAHAMGRSEPKPPKRDRAPKGRANGHAAHAAPDPAPAAEHAQAPEPAAESKPARPKAHGNAAPHHKITLCHATGSRTNPYVLITVSVNATTANGHGRHEDDLIPAPAAGCPSGASEDPGDGGGGGGGGGDHDSSAGGSGGDVGADDPSPAAQPTDPPAVFQTAPQEDLPLTGLSVWLLALLGAATATAGGLLRLRGRRSEPR
jgi:hypothetical protein